MDRNSPSDPALTAKAADWRLQAPPPSRLIPYKALGGGRALHLHCFDPSGLQKGDQRPCYLVIHGGGWSGGSAELFYPHAEDFAGRGWFAASLEYRLFDLNLHPGLKAGSVKARYPGTTIHECVEDARSAVRYLRQHAAELGIDPAKIVVAGSSAGGHLALGTALSEGPDTPREDLGISSVPNALVLFSPVTDISGQGYGHAAVGEGWEAISPLHQVRHGLPPTLIFHGTEDRTTPFAGTRAFQVAMEEVGNRCELVVEVGGGHGHTDQKALFGPAMRRSREFLRSLGLLDRCAANRDP